MHSMILCVLTGITEREQHKEIYFIRLIKTIPTQRLYFILYHFELTSHQIKGICD